uniref:ZP domain-containing protein n=1 Tax=Xiphophorus couchianus TaxID=32473 RepID=A0A3B5LJD2_9TELE
PLLNILHLTVFMFSCFAGAAAEKFDKATKFNLTLCPISFYQNVYQKVYVNFTNKNFAICFNGFYNSESNDDCIIGPKPDSAQAKFIIREKDSSYEAQSKAAVKTIRSSMTCSVHFDMIYLNGNLLLLFQVISMADVAVEGKLVGSVSLGSADSGFADISGCRISGNTKVFLFIDRSVTSTGCGEQEECDGSGRCFTNLICTVTGPTVIDFQGQQSSVKDRCVYSLVSDSSSGFEVLANFQERRRRDVSFLDSVSLRPAGSKVYFHLEQGGRIKTVLTLKSPVQQFKDISLSKDKNGLTATSLFSGLKMSALFDGYTAQIHMRGRNKQGSNELIIILQLFNEVDLLRFFLFFCFASCERQYEDPVDSQIDRNLISEQCNLLRAAPFSSCNKNVDPTPYISACNRTLCEYSSADGLGCQFLWAYATACKLKSNITLGRWWLDAGCSEPQALCQDKLCSDHEFCGRKHSGKTGCLCRALFASKYKLSGTLGEPAVCRKNSGSITLVGCLLEEKGINYSVLHLNDRSCRGVMDEENHMVTFSFDSSNTCGTEIMNNGSWINYKNTIITQSSSDVVTRHDQVFIDFSCYHTQPDIKIVALKIKDNSVVQHIKSGEWSYSVSMKVYEDGAYTRAVNSGVLLNQKIWVELKTDGLDAKTIAVVMDSCWATSKESHDLKPRYDLIIDGCADPNDGTVEVEGNGAGTSTYFSFNMFEFSGNSGDVYLHCKIQLCPKQENNCIPDCYNEPIGERRSVRSPKTNTYPAIISMAWGH